MTSPLVGESAPQRELPNRTRRWWPYLAVAGLFWVVPGVVLLVGYLTLPDFNASGQCEGIGFGCTLAPKDGTVFVAILYYPFAIGAGLLIMGVIALARACRHHAP